MPLAVRYNAELGIVESKMTGVVSPEELDQVTIEMVASGRKHGCDFYVGDFSEAEVDFSSLDVEELPALQEAEGMDRCAQIALIAPRSETGRQLAEYYETICFNRAWSARVVPDRESALAWLLDH